MFPTQSQSLNQTGGYVALLKCVLTVQLSSLLSQPWDHPNVPGRPARMNEGLVWTYSTGLCAQCDCCWRDRGTCRVVPEQSMPLIPASWTTPEEANAIGHYAPMFRNTDW
ncbi:hypothetical protein NDU88_008741 [Pleurodeles waltl]|uniref:Uncharacterized protein n=1 Tax=Pleurodeles waltl TaxID=8319 RepID=A0AAV7NWX6_PLEWA|nr:hypothetical protein NDU88_008741 [Pleurodeles waltl]